MMLRKCILDFHDAFGSYNNKVVAEDATLKEGQISWFEKSTYDIIEKLGIYKEELAKGEFDEVLDPDFWKKVDYKRWLKDKHLENILPEEGIKKLAAILREVKDLTLEIPEESYIRFYQKQKVSLDFESVEDTYKLWKMEAGKLNFNKLKKKQTEVVARFLCHRILKYADEASVAELREVDIDKVKEWLSENQVFPSDFKDYCARFRRYISWSGHILIIDYGEYGRYVCLNMSKLTFEERMEIFQLDKMLSLIHKDMMKLEEDEKKKKKAETQITLIGDIDKRICKAICTLRKEEMIEHLYDYTWVMAIMNEMDDLPSFSSPKSFIDYLASLGIQSLPSLSTIKKKYSKMGGKFPNWIFEIQDSNEVRRRINIAKRFLNLYRIG